MSYLWDDEAGYDRDDPKHPSFAEQWLDYVDEQRKREKKDGPEGLAEHLREAREVEDHQERKHGVPDPED